MKKASGKALQRAKLQEYKNFLQDTLDLFSGSNSGHMNLYAFNEPDPSIADDPVRGGEYWAKFVNNAGDYYLITEEAKVITDNAQAIAGILPPHSVCIDLGPGEETAVLTKTLPLLCEMRSVAAYVPIDVHAGFVSSATAVVKRHTGIDSYGTVADFFQDGLAFPAGPRVMFLFGGLLCNLGKGLQPALEELSGTMSLLRRHVRPGDHMIITQDINQDEMVLAKAYNHADLGRYVLTTLHKIRRDLPTQHFNPDAFEFYSEWNDDDHLQILGARAKSLMTFSIDGHAFALRPGDKLPLVNCYKFPLEKFVGAAERAGFSAERVFMSKQGRIALHVLTAV